MIHYIRSIHNIGQYFKCSSLIVICFCTAKELKIEICVMAAKKYSICEDLQYNLNDQISQQSTFQSYTILAFLDT